jgi:hypothetical protein
MADVINLMAQATTAPAWVDAPLTRAVPDTEAARFTNALQAVEAPGRAAPDQLAPAAPAIDGASPVAGEGPVSLGDAILNAMAAAGQTYQAKKEVVNTALTSGAERLGPMDLIRLQIGMADASLYVDILGKGVSKAVQNIDQLTKLQ